MRADDDVARRVGAAALLTVFGLALLVWAACYLGDGGITNGELRTARERR